MLIPDVSDPRANLRQLAIVEPCCLLEEEGKGDIEMLGTGAGLARICSVRSQGTVQCFDCGRNPVSILGSEWGLVVLTHNLRLRPWTAVIELPREPGLWRYSSRSATS